MVFGSGSPLADITPLHLAIRFLMPLVMAALAVLITARGRLASSNAGLTPREPTLLFNCGGTA